MVTASLAVATVLADAEKISVILLGGRVRGSTMATVDHWASRMLAGFVIDLAYVGANGISREYGLTTPTRPSARSRPRPCAAPGGASSSGSTPSSAR